MTTFCNADRCPHVLHPWCKQRYSDFCAAHQGKAKRKDADKASSSKQCIRSALDDEGVLRRMKEDSSELHADSSSTGSVFWYAISDYFPAEAQLTQWPDFASASKIDPLILEYPPSQGDEDYVSALIEMWEAEVAETSKRIDEIKASVPCQEPKQVRPEESAILVELKLLEFRQSQEDYLNYFEKSQEFKETPTQQGKSSKGAARPVKPDDDCLCEVCGDGDYDEDDLIVICSVRLTQHCEKGFHMHCYGIPEVPEGDWICDLCNELGEGAESPPCALCVVRGGAVKPTIHSAEGSTFPNYSNCTSLSKVWCHVFCARQLAGVVVSDPTHFSGIDLSRIHPSKFKLECEACETRSGACLQCNYKKCLVAYHPECGKLQYVETRVRSDIEEVKLFCNLHKPSKLRRQLVVKEKKHIDEVVGFSKAFEEARKTDDPRKKRKRPQEVVCHQLEKPFTLEEDLELEMKLDRVLRAVRKHCQQRFTVSFRLNSKSKRGQASVIQPRYYTLIAPEVILKDRVKIDGRTVSETFAHYKERQYPRLKRELDASSLPFTVYRNRVTKFIRSDEKRKRKTTKKLTDFFTPPAVTVRPANIETEELFCICRKPYVEMATADPNMTDEEFKAQMTDNTMLQCMRCEDWFHWGCMRLYDYDPAILDEKQNLDFFCPTCSPKLPKHTEIGGALTLTEVS